jgi:hypothetical protein
MYRDRPQEDEVSNVSVFPTVLVTCEAEGIVGVPKRVEFREGEASQISRTKKV